MGQPTDEAAGSDSTLAGLVGLSDYVFQRTRARLEGLSDEEYFWEPAPGCWTVRPRRDGTFRRDFVIPAHPPEPVTTLAWRLCHLADCYGEDRTATWLGNQPEAAVGDPAGGVPGTAAGAIEWLEAAHGRWRAHLMVVTPEQLTAPMGSIAGPYANDSGLGFVLHMLDEYIHHGAELALLRDLYRARAADTGPDSAVADADPATQPALLDEMAAIGRWDRVEELLDRGFRSTAAPSALHLAAGAGELEIVRRLVESGMDTTAADPDFKSTPLGWAEFMRNDAVAAYLKTQPM